MNAVPMVMSVPLTAVTVEEKVPTVTGMPT